MRHSTNIDFSTRSRQKCSSLALNLCQRAQYGMPKATLLQLQPSRQGQSMHGTALQRPGRTAGVAPRRVLGLLGAARLQQSAICIHYQSQRTIQRLKATSRLSLPVLNCASETCMPTHLDFAVRRTAHPLLSIVVTRVILGLGLACGKPAE